MGLLSLHVTPTGQQLADAAGSGPLCGIEERGIEHDTETSCSSSHLLCSLSTPVLFRLPVSLPPLPMRSTLFHPTRRVLALISSSPTRAAENGRGVEVPKRITAAPARQSRHNRDASIVRLWALNSPVRWLVDHCHSPLATRPPVFHESRNLSTRPESWDRGWRGVFLRQRWRTCPETHPSLANPAVSPPDQSQHKPLTFFSAMVTVGKEDEPGAVQQSE